MMLDLYDLDVVIATKSLDTKTKECEIFMPQHFKSAKMVE
jgi:hypothetical protein